MQISCDRSTVLGIVGDSKAESFLEDAVFLIRSTHFCNGGFVGMQRVGIFAVRTHMQCAKIQLFIANSTEMQHAAVSICSEGA